MFRIIKTFLLLTVMITYFAVKNHALADGNQDSPAPASEEEMAPMVPAASTAPEETVVPPEEESESEPPADIGDGADEF